MAIHFTGLSNQGSIAKNDRTAKDNVAKSTVDQSTPSADNVIAKDTVNLSGTAKTLKNHEAKINSMPDMDQDKVDKIKHAIASGSYKIDTHKLANNMASMDSLF